jgi:hypothetical protein
MSTSINTRWLYSYEDYVQMFSLHEQDLAKRILNIPGGMSDFNAKASAAGADVVTVGGFYDLDLETMQQYTDDLMQHYIHNFNQATNLLVSAQQDFTTSILARWQLAQQNFMADIVDGLAEQRYLLGRFPQLPFADNEFELALCSDLVFDQEEATGCTYIEIISELTRIATEVRIFPLNNSEGVPSEELGPALLTLQQNNFGAEVKEIPFHQLQGSNAMLRIWDLECKV